MSRRRRPASPKFLPQDRLDSGAFVLLVQASGKVFAATTAGLSHVGSNVGDFFPEVSAIRRFGDRAGVIETTISGVPHYAEITLIGNAGGYIVAATSLDEIGRLWREELTLNVTLFAGISSILLVILYAYYTQVKRARDADDIFVEFEPARRDRAVARPLRTLGFRFRQPRILLVALDVRHARPARLRQDACASATPRG